MRIPEDIVDEIISRSDVVDIVGDYVNLELKGKNYVGICPFHDDTNPSLSVSPDLNIYKCFVCGKSGSPVSFLMDYNGMNYPEALKLLAGKYGIRIPESKGKASSEKYTRTELAGKALESAASFFHGKLNKDDGKFVKDYFSDRGYSEATIKKFKLGYSPDSWDETSKFLKKTGLPEDSLVEAGLVIKKDTGGIYDRFRGRAMFPIRNFLGKIAGFGARKLKDDDKSAKYINSPQSTIYDKSKILYGLYEGLKNIRESKFAILTEGYADTIALHQAGFPQTVASSGTSLTNEQIRILSRYCSKLYLAFDSDYAGQMAAERAIEIALPSGMEIFIIQMPEGEDPDSVIQKNGKEYFEELIEKAEPFLEFLTKRLKQSPDFSTPAGKSQAVRKILKNIMLIKDKLQHDLYIRKMAPLLKLSHNQIKEIYDLYNDSSKQTKQIPAFKNENQKGAAEFIKRLKPEEAKIIYIILTSPGIIEELVEVYGLSVDNMLTQEGKRLLEIIFKHSDQEKILDKILADENVKQLAKDILTDIAVGSEAISENWETFSNISISDETEKEIDDSFRKLELAHIDIKLEEIRSEYSQGEPETNTDLLEKYNKLIALRSELTNKLLNI